jgi:hypothetical protein
MQNTKTAILERTDQTDKPVYPGPGATKTCNQTWHVQPPEPTTHTNQPQKPCKTPKPRSSNGLTKLTNQFTRAWLRPKHEIKLDMSSTNSNQHWLHQHPTSVTSVKPLPIR